MLNQKTNAINENATFVSIETTAFSGATLLSFLLGAHPEIATIAEMDGLLPNTDPKEYSCSCGKIITQCEFWHDVTNQMERRGEPFDLKDFSMRFSPASYTLIDRLKFGSLRKQKIDQIRDSIVFSFPNESHRLTSVTRRNEAFLESVLAVTQKKVFVDSSKDRLRIKGMNRFSNLQVKAIHLVRDVKGVVASDIRHGKKGDVQQFAHDWYRRHNRLKLMLESEYKGRYIRVLYEDLCLRPNETMEEIYQFCDVDPSFKIGDFEDVSHHLIGNPMRLSAVTEIRLDERWRKELTAEQISDIQQVAGNLSEEFGYQLI